MTKKYALGLGLLLAAAAGPAQAAGQPGSVGIGVESTISGVGGVSANYDVGQFILGGFFSFDDPPGGDNTDIQIGGRFFYKIAATASSDFSIGGSLALENQSFVNGAGESDSNNFMFLEPSFQIRLFLGTSNNVALSFTGGISIGLNDADGVVVDGQTTGIAGVHYYF